MLDISIVTQIHIPFNAVQEGVACKIQIAVVHHQRIKGVSRFERAHLAEKRSTGLSSQIKRFAQRQESLVPFGSSILELAHLERILDYAQNREMIAAGDIRTERHWHSIIKERTHRRHAGSQIAIGGRTMHYHHLLLLHQFEFSSIRIAAGGVLFIN